MYFVNEHYKLNKMSILIYIYKSIIKKTFHAVFGVWPQKNLIVLELYLQHFKVQNLISTRLW